MQVTFSKLIGLPVFTVSGKKLGKVSGGIVDTESHAVRSYEVRPSMFKVETLVINISQVRSITEEKMEVDDAILHELEKPSAAPGPTAWGAATPITED
jgi:sporulation protein YlmC with PRC-barrel domain